MNDLSGQSLGRYHLIEKLGEGGMAVVYKAFDTRLECEVAVKVIRIEQLAPSILETALKRFEREAKAVAQLTHPNIVKVTDFGKYNETPFIVMEYLPSGTLKQYLGKTFSVERAAQILLPIAEALQFAHMHNIIHRDVKPSNILITETGQPMLTDFGIAKMLDIHDGQTLTGTGVGIGTPEYMAPEQWTGQITPAVDIYSLGVVFYEMVTGHKPYEADTPAAILLKQTHDPLPSPRVYNSKLSQEAERFIFKAMSVDVKNRYSSMSEVIQSLQIFAHNTKPGLGLFNTNLISHSEEKTEDSLNTVLEDKSSIHKENTLMQDKTKFTQLSKMHKFLYGGIIGGIIILSILLISNHQITIKQTSQKETETMINLYSTSIAQTAIIIDSFTNSLTQTPESDLLSDVALTSTPTIYYTPIIEPSPTIYLTPTLDYVAFKALNEINCRYGADTSFHSMVVVHEDEILPIIGKLSDGSWLLIQDDDQQCWVFSELGEVIGSLSKISRAYSPSTATVTPLPTATLAPTNSGGNNNTSGSSETGCPKSSNYFCIQVTAYDPNDNSKTVSGITVTYKNASTGDIFFSGKTNPSGKTVFFNVPIRPTYYNIYLSGYSDGSICHTGPHSIQTTGTYYSSFQPSNPGGDGSCNWW